MDYPSPALTPTRPAATFERGPARHDHWQLARAAHVDLLLMGMPRINLLLIAPDGVLGHVLRSLQVDMCQPLVEWSPGEALDLPVPSIGGTMILHDVQELNSSDQQRLLEWLEVARGRTQVVSTTSMPLLPRVNAGQFIATLFYRLNTVCVDVTTLSAQPS